MLWCLYVYKCSCVYRWKLCTGWRQYDRIIKQETGWGSRWQHSPGIKSMEATGDHLQDWIPILLWSNCSCFSGFCSFPTCSTRSILSDLSWPVPPHLILPWFCIHTFSYHCLYLLILVSEFINWHLSWLQSHFLVCKTSVVDMWHIELTQQDFTITLVSFTECQFGQHGHVVIWHTLPAFKSIQIEMDLTLTLLLYLLNCSVLTVSIQTTCLLPFNTACVFLLTWWRMKAWRVGWR